MMRARSSTNSNSEIIAGTGKGCRKDDAEKNCRAYQEPERWINLETAPDEKAPNLKLMMLLIFPDPPSGDKKSAEDEKYIDSNPPTLRPYRRDAMQKGG